MSSERILQMSFSRFFIGLQFLKSHIQIYTKLFRYRYSLQPCGLEPTRLLHPWDSPGKNTGVGCHFLLQGIFPTQGLNPGLLHGRQILYHLSPREILLNSSHALKFAFFLMFEEAALCLYFK